MAAVNLLFLDVDGVLNTTSDHRKMNNKYYWVRDDLVDYLASIIVKTDARVVISSTWRFSPEMVAYVSLHVPLICIYSVFLLFLFAMVPPALC